jgi:CobQ-like glutamine amidotransferase family enzyme
VADSEVAVGLLFPDLLGTYGDRGNAVVLARRLAWRGLTGRIVEVGAGDPVPGGCDLYVLGGGEDQAQRQALEQLRAGGLAGAVERGAGLLAVCAGYQLVGTSYEIEPGRSQPGLALLDVETVRGAGPRRVGEVTVVTALDGVGRLRGYENHAGVTRVLGDDALGRRVDAAGHDLGPEGAVRGAVVGTYLHGPVLARNPALADWLLAGVLGSPLPPLDERGAAAAEAHRRATDLDRIPAGPRARRARRSRLRLPSRR